MDKCATFFNGYSSCRTDQLFEVLIVIIKKLDNGRKETTNHLIIYALQEGNSEGGGGGGERGEGNSYTRRLRPKEVLFSGFWY